jgi:hypothetical protein
MVAIRISRRRSGVASERWRRERRPGRIEPGDLERKADEAERNGDLELALRLRFRAGLLRLGYADVVPLRDSLTSGEARRRLRLPEFDLIAATFDEVVYGRRAPVRDDLEQARSGWPRVLQAVTAR